MQKHSKHQIVERLQLLVAVFKNVFLVKLYLDLKTILLKATKIYWTVLFIL